MTNPSQSAGSSQIAGVDAWQVLDSRGRPTVRARVQLADGTSGTATAPSGASTGTHEVHELRDGGVAWGGRGVVRAVSQVKDVIGPAITGADSADQEAVDAIIAQLDGPTMSTIGGNAAIAVSVAVNMAHASSLGIELWQVWTKDPLLPMPMVNIVSGGAHAGRLLDIQDVLVVPVGASSIEEAISWCADVREASAAIAASRGLPASLVADEGGIAGAMGSNRAGIELVLEGIIAAGLEPGTDMAIALDIAATQFMGEDGRYHLSLDRRDLSAHQWVDEVADWIRDLHVVSVEDPLAEDDWSGWSYASQKLAGIQLLGDDLFVTSQERLRRGIDQGIASSVLVKVNQCGTVSGARRVVELAQQHGYTSVVSARSGETEESWLADLAVGWRAGQIKVGSTTRSERTAKWNRLLDIAHAYPSAQLAPWPFPVQGQPRP